MFSDHLIDFWGPCSRGPKWHFGLRNALSEKIHAGPIFALAQIQEKNFEEVLPEYFANFLAELYSVRIIHAAPVFAPARMQENTPGKLFMYAFRARGYFGFCMGSGRLQNMNCLICRIKFSIQCMLLLHI